MVSFRDLEAEEYVLYVLGGTACAHHLCEPSQQWCVMHIHPRLTTPGEQEGYSQERSRTILRYNPWLSSHYHCTAVKGSAKNSSLLQVVRHPLSGVYMKGGRATPEADTHDRTVCILPLSAEVTDQTFWRPTSVTTFPGFWATDTLVSSVLKICIGFARMSSRAKTTSNYPKKREWLLYLRKQHIGMK